MPADAVPGLQTGPGARGHGPAGCERGWNVEMELATPAHGGYFREPASRVNK